MSPRPSSFDRRQVLQAGAAALIAPQLMARRGVGLAPRKVLLVDIDDVGQPFFDACLTSGFAPRVAALRPLAMEFRNFWAAPVCSAFRARLLTGLESHRPGNWVGANVPSFNLGPWPGPAGKWITHGMPGRRTKRGKWHLTAGGPALWPKGVVEFNALKDGYDEYSGSKSNLTSYYSWSYGRADRSGTNSITTTTQFATNVTWDDARKDVALGVEFVHASFNAIHSPLDQPPQNEPPGVSYPLGNNQQDMLLHLDYRLGSLIQQALAANYVVILAGDNGTSGAGKGSHYEKGLRTPLMVWGSGLASGVTTRLVSAVDLWSTVRYLRGCADTTSASDSRNFADAFVPGLTPQAPPRTLLFNDTYPGYGTAPIANTWRRSVRSERWKLIDMPDALPPEPLRAFFDLRYDPDEQNNLLLAPLSSEAGRAYARLLHALP